MERTQGMNTPKNGEFCWNELATTDVKSAKLFYENLLGWEYVERDVDGMTYTMIKGKDDSFGGIWQIPTEQKDEIPPHWMGYILVDNVDDIATKAKQLGATIKMPSTQVGDFGRMLLIVDPTGAHIAFWQAL